MLLFLFCFLPVSKTIHSGDSLKEQYVSTNNHKMALIYCQMLRSHVISNIECSHFKSKLARSTIGVVVL